MISFLQHHGVTITIQHFHAWRLPSTREAVAKVHFGFTTSTTTSSDLDYTIRTSCTPNSCSSCILQHFDRSDIFRSDLQQSCELLLVIHIIKVKRTVVIIFKYITINNNQRILATIDWRHTTQTHSRAGTQVTRVWNDVKTSNFTLKSVSSCFKWQTSHLVHVKSLLSRWNFTFRNYETIRTSFTRRSNLSSLKRIFINEFNVEMRVATNWNNFCLVANIRYTQSVSRILDNHREITISISLCSGNVTIILILLDYIRHHNRTICFTPDTSRDALLCISS